MSAEDARRNVPVTIIAVCFFLSVFRCKDSIFFKYVR
jgi:hypothetical protein